MKAWSEVLSAIKTRVNEKHRLTVRQGEALLAQHEQVVKQNEELQRQNRDLSIQHAQDEAWLNRRINEWNALTDMLSTVLKVKIYSNESRTGTDGSYTLLWTAEYDSKERKGHSSVATAYETVLKERLHGTSNHN